MQPRPRIPEPTISRLPLYFRCLRELHQQQASIVSSEEVARRAGVKASQFRKDLSYFGEFGIQGLGYPVGRLLDRIAGIMRLDRSHQVVLVGAGNLGTALAGYGGFAGWGFRIVSVYDQSPQRIGQELCGLRIADVAELPRPLGVEMGLIAVPAGSAPGVCRLLQQSGVRAMLNFSGVQLSPDPADEGVVVRNVDMNHELAVLAYHVASRAHGP